MMETEVIPATAENEWRELEKKVAVVAPVVQWVHVYVSDGSMGTTATITDFSRLPELTRAYPELSFEAHLLTASPEKYVRPLADAGFTRIIAHVESNDPRRFLEEAKFDDVEVGIAIDGATEIDQVEPFLEDVDFLVVMSTEVGATSRTFLPEALEKVKLVHQNYPDLPIEAVGGITDATVKSVKDAGASRVVASEYIFTHPEGAAIAVDTLKNA